jgi:S-adenosylmethionine decarboxylase proenzyme
MKWIALLLTLTSLYATEPEEYKFVGRHFIACYYDCDREALNDFDGFTAALHEASMASGATVLDSMRWAFVPQGFSVILLLSESHASVHTYPEHGSCFVDLFTCGENCSSEKFNEVLQKYLKPKKTDGQEISRGEF